MSGIEIAPPPYDASVTALEHHPLKPIIRPVETSDLPVILAHIGTTNPSYLGATSLAVLENRFQHRKRDNFPYLMLLIPMPIAKTLKIHGKALQSTESERISGQQFVGLAEVSKFEPTLPQWRKTLELGVNMPDWANARGLTKLLVDAVIEDLSFQYDTPTGKPPQRESFLSRFSIGETRSIPKPIGDQKKYKNLIMLLYIKSNNSRAYEENLEQAVRYGYWGFKQIGTFNGVIEYEGEGYDVCYYQRSL